MACLMDNENPTALLWFGRLLVLWEFLRWCHLWCSVLQLKKKADMEYAQRLAWEERQRQREMKAQLKERDHRNQVLERAERQAEMEKLRQQAQLLAQVKQEETRERIRRKLMKADLRMVQKEPSYPNKFSETWTRSLSRYGPSTYSDGWVLSIQY